MENAKEHFPEETRQRILNAAGIRFTQYGYNKTTMAEIAGDCEMSAANLYRYFENKLAIGAELACTCLAERVTKLKQVVSNQGLPCATRLQRFVQTSLDLTYTQWSETPRINEMVTAICQERFDIVKQHVHQKQTLLISLLREGNQSGEFSVADPELTAEAIHTAITLFNVPLFMPMYTRGTLERKADSVTALLLNGLVKQ